MLKKREINKLTKFTKVGIVCATIFLLVWFSYRSIEYSIENKVPTLYIIANERITNANVLQKAKDLGAFDYSSPIEYAEKNDIPYRRVERGEEFQLQTEKIENIKPEKIKKEEVYFKRFINLNPDSMKDAEIVSLEVEDSMKIKVKAPDQPGKYIYHLVVKYNNKSIDYVFRIKVGE